MLQPLAAAALCWGESFTWCGCLERRTSWEIGLRAQAMHWWKQRNLRKGEDRGIPQILVSKCLQLVIGLWNVAIRSSLLGSFVSLLGKLGWEMGEVICSFSLPGLGVVY